VKRAKFLWPLTQGHHHGLVASKHIRERLEADPTDPALSREIQAFQKADLEPHFKAEEELLDALELSWGATDPDLVRTRMEHTELRRLAASAQHGDMALFGENLGEHIRYEEEKLFDRFESSLRADEIEKWADRFKHTASFDPLIPKAPRR
jgi:hypothetical protein